MIENTWSQKCDEVLKYLYQDLNIFNWSLIAKELASRLSFNVTSSQCLQRYVKKYGQTKRRQWSPAQQKQLFRLHNQYGNRWAVISQKLLGRSDNCVKNHFYSKLRKSLRTINKIGKLYFKKQVKQIGDSVIYKLTEVTDQSLKQNSELPEAIISMSFELKNKLLEYEKQQKDIQKNLDYTFQKQILVQLSQFNKKYKKKPKKEKIAFLANQYLKNRRKTQKASRFSNQIQISNQSISEFYMNSQQHINQHENSANKVLNKSHIKQTEKKVNINQQVFLLPCQSFINFQSKIYNIRSQSEYSSISVAKKAKNYLIKAPPLQKQNEQKKQMVKISSEKNQKSLQKLHLTDILLPQRDIKSSNKVQDILKKQGILQNQNYGTNFDTYIRRTNSSRSFSICSDSSHPDMFGQDNNLYIPIFNELSSVNSQSQIFENKNYY